MGILWAAIPSLGTIQPANTSSLVTGTEISLQDYLFPPGDYLPTLSPVFDVYAPNTTPSNVQLSPSGNIVAVTCVVSATYILGQTEPHSVEWGVVWVGVSGESFVSWPIFIGGPFAGPYGTVYYNGYGGWNFNAGGQAAQYDWATGDYEIPYYSSTTGRSGVTDAPSNHSAAFTRYAHKAFGSVVVPGGGTGAFCGLLVVKGGGNTVYVSDLSTGFIYVVTQVQIESNSYTISETLSTINASWLALTADNGTIWYCDTIDGYIAATTTSNVAGAYWPVSGLSGGICLDPDGDHAWVGIGSTAQRINLSTGVIDYTITFPAAVAGLAI